MKDLECPTSLTQSKLTFSLVLSLPVQQTLSVQSEICEVARFNQALMIITLCFTSMQSDGFGVFSGYLSVQIRSSTNNKT